MQGPKITYIYGLKDPRDGQIHYVGKSDNPKARYKQHMNKRMGQAKIAWIKSLEQEGLRPELTIIEKVLRSEWREQEQYWIAKGHEEGWPLTNATAGGEGYNGGKQMAWYEFMRGYVPNVLWPVFEAMSIRERDALVVKSAQTMVKKMLEVDFRGPLCDALQVQASRCFIGAYLATKQVDPNVQGIVWHG